MRAAKQPSFVGLQTFALGPGHNTVAAAPTSLKLAPGMLGGDSTALSEAYELGTKPAYVGAPIVSAIGEVVALVARACPAGSAAGCTPVPYAAPVGALKRFLQRVPAQATWLGVEAVGDEVKGVRGVRVSAVIPDSPAALAGLRPGKDAAVADLIDTYRAVQTPATRPPFRGWIRRGPNSLETRGAFRRRHQIERPPQAVRRTPEAVPRGERSRGRNQRLT